VEKGGHFVNMLIRPLRLGRFWLILYIKFFEVYLSQNNRETFCCNLFQVKCYISPAISHSGVSDTILQLKKHQIKCTDQCTKDDKMLETTASSGYQTGKVKWHRQLNK